MGSPDRDLLSTGNTSVTACPNRNLDDRFVAAVLIYTAQGVCQGKRRVLPAALDQLSKAGTADGPDPPAENASSESQPLRCRRLVDCENCQVTDLVSFRRGAA